MSEGEKEDSAKEEPPKQIKSEAADAEFPEVAKTGTTDQKADRKA
jgi:hypothetical protein